MTRITAQIDSTLLGFTGGVADRFVYSTQFVGRDLDTPASYQVDAVRGVAERTIQMLKGFSDAARDAAAVVESGSSDDPRAAEALRIARAVNPLVPLIERRGPAAIPASLDPERLDEKIANVRTLLADDAALGSVEGRKELLAVVSLVDQVKHVTGAAGAVASTSYAMDSELPEDGESTGPSTSRGPTIDHVLPASAGPGASIRTSGSKFGQSTDGSITVGGVAAAVTQWTTSAITLTVPTVSPGATTIEVETADGTAKAAFTVLSSITPSGTSGTTTTSGNSGGAPTAGGGQVTGILESLLDSGLGYLFQHRTRISPRGFALGEHLYTLSLAPGEEATLEQKTFSKRDVSLEELLDENREIDIELSSTYSTELAEAVNRDHELSSKLDVANRTQIGAKATIPIKSVPVELNASSSLDIASSLASAAKTAESESRKSSYERSSKVASKLRAQHRTTFKVSAETGFERTGKRVIRNPNRGTALDLHFFKVMAALVLHHERYGARLCWAPYVKDPGAGVRRRAAAAAERARLEIGDPSLPPKPDPPADAERRRKQLASATTDLKDHFGFWNDMRVDVDLAVEAGGKDWDGSTPELVFNFSGSRPHGAHVVGDPWRDGTKLMVKVHVGIDWTLTEGRGSASVQVKLGVVDVSDADAAKAMKDYRAQLAEWEKEIAKAKAETARAAGLASSAATDPVLDGYDPMTELLTSVVSSHFPPTTRDDFREVDFWSRVFDVEHGGYALYPGIWAGADLALPERGASDFLNASWARVFLPIRAGFETQALEFILAGGAARLSPQQRQTIKTLVDELNKFRNDHFGDPTGIAIDPQTHKVTDSFDLLAEWNETTPTDGTHAEAVLATTTALDEASEQLLSDEADLRKASIRERVDDAALKEKAEKMMTAPSTGVTITANGQ